MTEKLVETLLESVLAVWFHVPRMVDPFSSVNWPRKSWKSTFVHILYGTLINYQLIIIIIVIIIIIIITTKIEIRVLISTLAEGWGDYYFCKLQTHVSKMVYTSMHSGIYWALK